MQMIKEPNIQKEGLQIYLNVDILSVYIMWTPSPQAETTPLSAGVDALVTSSLGEGAQQAADADDDFEVRSRFSAPVLDLCPTCKRHKS